MSCKKTKEQPIPPIYHLLSEGNIAVKNDTVFFNGTQYDGFLYQLSPNGKDTLTIEGFKNGLLSGISKKVVSQWSIDGRAIFSKR